METDELFETAHKLLGSSTEVKDSPDCKGATRIDLIAQETNNVLVANWSVSLLALEAGTAITDVVCAIRRSSGDNLAVEGIHVGGSPSAQGVLYCPTPPDKKDVEAVVFVVLKKPQGGSITCSLIKPFFK